MPNFTKRRRQRRIRRRDHVPAGHAARGRCRVLVARHRDELVRFEPQLRLLVPHRAGSRRVQHRHDDTGAVQRRRAAGRQSAVDARCGSRQAPIPGRFPAATSRILAAVLVGKSSMSSSIQRSAADVAGDRAAERPRWSQLPVRALAADRRFRARLVRSMAASSKSRSTVAAMFTAGLGRSVPAGRPTTGTIARRHRAIHSRTGTPGSGAASNRPTDQP